MKKTLIVLLSLTTLVLAADHFTGRQPVVCKSVLNLDGEAVWVCSPMKSVDVANQRQQTSSVVK